MKPLQDTRHPFTVAEEIALCKKFTDTYKAYLSKDICSREAACLSIQYPACMCPPQPGDLFAGRVYSPLIQFSPQPGFMAMGYCIQEDRLESLRNDPSLTELQKNTLDDLSTYWLREETKQYIKKHYPANVEKWLPYDNYFKERAVAHPLYRMSGTQLDYGKLLTLGIDGLHQIILEKRMYCDDQAKNFYNGLHQTLNIFTSICKNYVNQIDTILTDNAIQDSWRKELLEMKKSIAYIAHAPAKSFRDAIQLTYLWWAFSGSLNFARMDTYLASYYVNDVDKGIITEERALELLCGLWQMIEIKHRVYDSRIIIGGKGRKDEDVCNRFCLLAIKATRKLHSVVPQLSLRFYDGLDQKVYNEALQAIGEGCTFPMLYNDDVNIRAVSKAFCISEELAEHYCPYGCGEYVLEHQSVGTPSGIINLAKALEVTLFHGKDPETGEQLGLDLGGLETYDSFDALLAAYKKQVEHFVLIMAKMEELEYVYSGKHCAFLTFSMLYDDCISRGKPLLSGGVRYLGGTLESYGNVNTADSLTAIKKLVYDEKTISKNDLLTALKTNFQFSPELRHALLNSPKYGNEDEMADSMLVSIHEHICNVTRDSVKNTILHSYLIVVINNDANTVLGHLTAATADGRLSGSFLANANNPQGGADQRGLTAMLNSIVKPPIHYHAGSVQNLKLNKEMFSKEMLPKTKALLEAYFKKGGAQLMITVVSREEMEDAVIHPEKHRDLIVRVGGFSARFVELGADVQQELLSRSLHG